MSRTDENASSVRIRFVGGELNWSVPCFPIWRAAVCWRLSAKVPPKEMGLAQGAGLRKKINAARHALAELEAFRLRRPRWLPYRAYRWLSGCKASRFLARCDHPEMSQRLAGIAEGAGVSLKSICLLCSIPMRFPAAPCAKSRSRGTRVTRMRLPLPCVGGGSISHPRCETSGSVNSWRRLTLSTAVGWGRSWLITAQAACRVISRPACMVHTGLQPPVCNSFLKSGECELPTAALAARISRIWFYRRITRGWPLNVPGIRVIRQRLTSVSSELIADTRSLKPLNRFLIVGVC